jgi:signal transduction histidine kinase/ActR/RegA family two-component response regulator
MLNADVSAIERRVLVLAPTGRDAANSAVILRKAGLDCTACVDLEELRREIEAGAAAVLLTEEPLALDRAGALAEVIARQPVWSDLPVLLLTRGGPESRVAIRAMQTLGNVILLERPVRVFTLVSATRMALRARSKQYQLRVQMAQLRQADARKDEFLATLAHELRNPLAPVRTGLQILKLAPSGPEAARTREMMERQVMHMVRLLDDLLDVSRISRGRVELQRERVALQTVVESALDLCRPSVAAGRHALDVELPAAPVWLYADVTRMAQVIGNILLNAAKYTPNGGKIDLVARREGAEVVLAVTDNGAGIPPELQAHVFEMFTQFRHGSDRSQSGIGVGLALVKALLELHGGSVAVHSRGSGCGSTFTLRMPVADDPGEAGSERLPGPVQAARAPLRVLVVDDNGDAAEALAMMLELAGHDTRTAADGPAGLAVARAFRPDVVFLDIGLPGLDGYKVAELMRAEPALAATTLVALSGWGSDEHKRRSQQAGFGYHLTKPADSEELTALLAAVSEAARG